MTKFQSGTIFTIQVMSCQKVVKSSGSQRNGCDGRLIEIMTKFRGIFCFLHIRRIWHQIYLLLLLLLLLFSLTYHHSHFLTATLVISHFLNLAFLGPTPFFYCLAVLVSISLLFAIPSPTAVFLHLRDYGKVWKCQISTILSCISFCQISTTFLKRFGHLFDLSLPLKARKGRFSNSKCKEMSLFFTLISPLYSV